MPLPGTSPTHRAEAELAADLAVLARLGLVELQGRGDEIRVALAGAEQRATGARRAGAGE